jgi:hypothetical protein
MCALVLPGSNQCRVTGTVPQQIATQRGQYTRTNLPIKAFSNSGTQVWCHGCSGRCAQRPTKLRALNSGRDLLIGDTLMLVSFCIYKQLMAIVLSPSFPGWLAPLHFDTTRCVELLGFTVTVAGTWVACSMLNGDYDRVAGSAFPVMPHMRLDVSNSSCFNHACLHADMQQALAKTCRTWLTSTPVMAAQLVLVTAAESGSLVLDEQFTEALPLVLSLLHVLPLHSFLSAVLRLYGGLCGCIHAR